MKILLTGASGFVGGALLAKLGVVNTRVLGRSRPSLNKVDFFHSEILPDSDFSDALKKIDVVIHAAARAHIMKEESCDPYTEYHKINTLGTLNLARQAVSAGVKRLIFISSIKVNGESTPIGQPFFYDDEPSPEDPYGQSKAEAERGLLELAQETGMEVVIIRPPLVYGPGVKANFATMINFAIKNLPLPLGAIKNKRSLVSIENLVDLIVTCIDHPKAAGNIFLVSDDLDVSTTELLKELTRAAGKKPHLIPIPMALVRGLAILLGKRAVADRLCGNLQLDITHTKNTLDWSPPVTFQEGITRCFLKDN